MKLLKNKLKAALASTGYTIRRLDPEVEKYVTQRYEFIENMLKLQKQHYSQSQEIVDALKKKYNNTTFGKFSVWHLVEESAKCFDPADRNLGCVSQQVHMLQILEGMEQDGITDKDMLIAAIIHDLAKVLLVPCEHPEYVSFANGIVGEYEPGIGLDNCTITYSQDEYLYSRIKDHVPDNIAWLVRYHGLSRGRCEHLFDERDRTYADRYLYTFAKYDLGSKSIHKLPQKRIEDYRDLVEEYFPTPLLF